MDAAAARTNYEATRERLLLIEALEGRYSFLDITVEDGPGEDPSRRPWTVLASRGADKIQRQYRRSRRRRYLGPNGRVEAPTAARVWGELLVSSGGRTVPVSGVVAPRRLKDLNEALPPWSEDLPSTGGQGPLDLGLLALADFHGRTAARLEEQAERLKLEAGEYRRLASTWAAPSVAASPVERSPVSVGDAAVAAVPALLEF